jgi:hypothetical protein
MLTSTKPFHPIMLQTSPTTKAKKILVTGSGNSSSLMKLLTQAGAASQKVI